ncbi:DUF4145 domain-containing protein [Streptomyces halobius]|uniref:DUF4145 domain-containing protein n=1 Tax=Streptomyces halobius TaxID=2879846 RepID=A0ABY4MAE4_9ACTN|nr:DUF4145 domain-containing protein [Streptomyces halobius]UQA93764.1 DUF4145 domain-containing protein [Streptomyces halobius]
MTIERTVLEEDLELRPGARLAGQCAHCRKHVAYGVLKYDALDPRIGFLDPPERLYEGLSQPSDVTFELGIICNWCNKTSLYVHRVRGEYRHNSDGVVVMERSTAEITQVWPAPLPRELADDAPQTVREIFAEAALAEAAGALRLAGVGYRAAVEQIVKERGAQGNSLYQRITTLSQLGVAQETVDAFHEARLVGNDAAHDGLAYSAEEIADIAELIEEAVLVLYVQPAQRARLVSQRAARRAAAKQASP